VEEMKGTSEGLFGLCAWNPGISVPGTEKESESFVEQFIRRFGKPPNTTTMHGYTSARALLAAVERAAQSGDELSGDGISRQLRALDLILPMEHLAFNQNGDPKHYEQVVIQIQKGKLVVVYPPHRANGKIMGR
jgi:branched-chain amino acid transport system substrate-binding protein